MQKLCPVNVFYSFCLSGVFQSFSVDFKWPTMPNGTASLCSYNVGCTKRMGLFPNRKTSLENIKRQRALNAALKNCTVDPKKKVSAGQGCWVFFFIINTIIFKASLTPPLLSIPAETTSRLCCCSIHRPLTASRPAGRVQPVF